MHKLILGKGFVGNSLAKHFDDNNISYKHVSQEELDYTDVKTFKSYVTAHYENIECVINCSGYTGVPNVDACETNKVTCYNYNVLFPLRVISVCEDLRIPIYHIGSGCIYSGYEKEYTEDDTPDFGIYSDESSYYSKCKHIFETFSQFHKCFVFRIRIPFTPYPERKNYFTKLLKYDTLINELNSVTSIIDFCDFMVEFLKLQPEYGIYNVVNPQPIKAIEVTELLKQHNLSNPNWNFIPIEKLDTKANRSNCVLSTKKISNLGLALPNTKESLLRDIVGLSFNTKS
jgi:dTDP-4-dehydrorhamnose reductase